mmetsp:Transcript_96708/g.250070  ORF Transcript_96708/g.250070 Transcript_96708/m.250070 type:complete len:240 (-) Transcript_96708:1122-1841(-)
MRLRGVCAERTLSDCDWLMESLATGRGSGSSVRPRKDRPVRFEMCSSASDSTNCTSSATLTEPEQSLSSIAQSARTCWSEMSEGGIFSERRRACRISFSSRLPEPFLSKRPKTTAKSRPFVPVYAAPLILARSMSITSSLSRGRCRPRPRRALESWLSVSRSTVLVISGWTLEQVMSMFQAAALASTFSCMIRCELSSCCRSLLAVCIRSVITSTLDCSFSYCSLLRAISASRMLRIIG